MSGLVHETIGDEAIFLVILLCSPTINLLKALCLVKFQSLSYFFPMNSMPWKHNFDALNSSSAAAVVQM